MASPFEEVVRAVPSWHPTVLTHIQDIIGKGIDQERDVDTALTMVTKEVEDAFRNMLQKRTGSKFPGLAGDNLVNEAVRQRVINSNTKDWHDFKGYFAEPRNPYHHGFPSYVIEDVVLFLMQSDRLLRKIDTLNNETLKGVKYTVTGLDGNNTTTVEAEIQDIEEGARAVLQLRGQRQKKEFPMNEMSKGKYECKLFEPDLDSFKSATPITASVEGVDSSGSFRTSGIVCDNSKLPLRYILDGSGSQGSGSQ